MRQFRKRYKCFSMGCMGRSDMDYTSDKIILPPTAIRGITSLHLAFPLFFRISKAFANSASSGDYLKEPPGQVVGVLEFTSEENSVHVPSWIMQNCNIFEGEEVSIKTIPSPSLATYCKLRPHDHAMVPVLQKMGPKYLLESHLRMFSALEEGGRLVLWHSGKSYWVDVLKTQPQKTVSLMGSVDLEVDFEKALNEKANGGIIEDILRGEINISDEKDPGDLGSGHVSGAKSEREGTPVPRPKSSSSTENGVVGGVWGIGKGGRHMRGSPKAKHKAGEVEVKFDSKRHGRCGNCNRIVPKANLIMHEVRCARMHKRCHICDALVKTSDMKSHLEDHEHVQCEFCDAKLSASDMEIHLSTICPQRDVECDLCNENVIAAQLNSHRQKCRNTTRTCPECNEEVLRGNWVTHPTTCSPICKCGMKVRFVEMKQHLLHHCTRRIIPCPFCKLAFPYADMIQHRGSCGSRTDKCSLCGQWVRLRDMETHHANSCKIMASIKKKNKKNSTSGNSKHQAPGLQMTVEIHQKKSPSTKKYDHRVQSYRSSNASRRSYRNSERSADAKRRGAGRRGAGRRGSMRRGAGKRGAGSRGAGRKVETKGERKVSRKLRHLDAAGIEHELIEAVKDLSLQEAGLTRNATSLNKGLGGEGSIPKNSLDTYQCPKCCMKIKDFESLQLHYSKTCPMRVNVKGMVKRRSPNTKPNSNATKSNLPKAKIPLLNHWRTPVVDSRLKKPSRSRVGYPAVSQPSPASAGYSRHRFIRTRYDVKEDMHYRPRRHSLGQNAQFRVGGVPALPKTRISKPSGVDIYTHGDRLLRSRIIERKSGRFRSSNNSSTMKTRPSNTSRMRR